MSDRLLDLIKAGLAVIVAAIERPLAGRSASSVAISERGSHGVPRWHWMAVCLMALSPLIEARSEAIDATDPRVLYEGRVAVDQAERAVRMAYPGVAIHLSTSSSRLTMHCHAPTDTVYLDISVDEWPFERRRLKTGDQEIVLYDGPSTRRDILVVKRTESWQGMLEVKSFFTDGGQLHAARPLPNCRLLFIGDSITCGAGSVIGPTDKESGPRNSSGRHAFGWVLSRRLDTQCSLVCYSGRGVLRDWEGRSWPNSINAAEFYDRALPDVAEATWEHANYRADAVAICLGANDLNLGLPRRSAFLNAYEQLVRSVRTHHPDAWIFLLDCPMFGDGEKRRFLSECLDEIANRLEGDRVEHLAIGYQPGSEQDSHPTASQHVAIAEELEPIYRSRLKMAP